jgi:hypothetical protein
MKRIQRLFTLLVQMQPTSIKSVLRVSVLWIVMGSDPRGLTINTLYKTVINVRWRFKTRKLILMFFKEEIATSSQPAYVGIAMMVASDDLINCCRSNAIFSFLFFSSSAL